jgi:hypothetical protein
MTKHKHEYIVGKSGTVAVCCHCSRFKHVGNNPVIEEHPCPLRDDYKGWSEEKKSDRLFMSCPGCGSYGSHVEAARA